MRPFPRWLVFYNRRPLGIVEALETVAFEFELAGLGLQPALKFLRVIGRQRMSLGDILLTIFPKPAERHRRAQFLLLGRHHVVAPADEFLPRYVLRQIGGVEQPLDPIDLVHALIEIIGKAEPLADFGEYPVVGLRFSKRRNRGRLENDDAVVELLLAMMAVAAEAGPFADVDALEIGAGRQDDVGELRLALEPDRLVDDEFEIFR